MYKTLCENIKSLRTSKKISQVELSKILGVTKQCISNWENDNIVPSIEMLIKIADFFDVSTDYLLGRTDKRTIDVSDLTDEQIVHVSFIVKNLKPKFK